MSGVQTLTLGADAHDQRLDRWLRRRFPQLAQGRIEKMCRKGEIRLDGGRVRANARLAPGQALRLPPLPDAPPPAAPARGSAITDRDAEMLRAAVLWQDDHLIALNKPPGLPVQGGSKQSRHVDALSAALVPPGAEKPRLVHRLDKDTSGILLLARDGRVAAALTRGFHARETRKIYWAAVAGVPRPRAATVRFALVKAPGHGPHGAGEKMLCLHPDEAAAHKDARHATTDYMVLEAAGRRAAWVALVPVTGRTHQLRAHMAQIGHPVVGDGKYGTNAQENKGDGWGAQLGGQISRKMHLHARHLWLTHPVTGARLAFTAPLPAHMAATWETFGWDAAGVPADPFAEDTP